MTKIVTAVVGGVCMVLAAVLPGLVGSADPSAVAARGVPRATAPAFTKTETIARDQVVGGVDQVVDTRTVTLDVNQTTNLQGRQQVAVSWSGAHPTGGIVPDQNSIGAQNEEYPFVLLECRGVDSATAPAADRLSPETCWTQSWGERYQDSLSDAYPPYRLDEYATNADRAQIAGAPASLPATCKYDEGAKTQHWVPFVAADGTVFPGGNAGCAGEPPEADNTGSSALPSNETYGVTRPDGTGSSSFDVWTSAQNASLGCSQVVPCALVAVPVLGISCDSAAGVPAADVTQCEETGAFAPGQLYPQSGGNDLAVSGSLWWSASNWRNRITVPLTFGVPPDACSVTTTGPSNVVDVYGSELLIQATGQWEPSFCLDPSSNFSFIHVQTGEPESRNLVATGSAEAAFTSFAQPGGYGKPVVNAPVALTGFAISYDVDDANGQPYTSLRLTPRLLAKLLTESYPAILAVQQGETALSHNPLDITLDPEFQALNPGIAKGVGAAEAASELVSISSDSDVIDALTTYINDDPTARAWLNGTPDPWGMVVNPAYRGIQLPVDQWPLLSTYEPTDYYQSDLNDCLYNSPVPFLPLVSAPLANLEAVSEAIQFAIANSTTTCKQIDGSTLGEKLTADGRQTTGFRFLIGITPLADSERYALRTAALQTTPGTYVPPSDTSLKAAASLLKPDTSSGTWPIPYATFQTAAGAAAYPGTMVVYAAIPSTGLPTADATDYGSLLRFIAGTGQTPGSGVGQLPPGYLPLTAANDLGTLASYTLAAATDVAAQNGQVPPVVPVTASKSPSTTATTSAPGSTTTTTTPPTTQPASEPASGDQSAGGSAVGAPSTSGSTSAGPAHTFDRKPPARPPGLLQIGRIAGAGLWTGDALPVQLLVFGLFGALLITAAYLEGRRRGRW
jgi:hypothetical protein